MDISLEDYQKLDPKCTVEFEGKKLIYLRDPVEYLKNVNKKILKSKRSDFILKINKFQKKQLLETING